MKPIAVLALLAAIITLPGWTGTDAAPQDEKKSVERLQDLEQAVKKLQGQLAEANATIKVHDALHEKTLGWFRKLDAVCTSLDGQMDQARQNGFEKAGPNPRAKKQVIDGLKAFAQQLSAGNPITPPKDSTSNR